VLVDSCRIDFRVTRRLTPPRGKSLDLGEDFFRVNLPGMGYQLVCACLNRFSRHAALTNNMNDSIPGPDDRLRALLREARPTVSVGPGFQDRVWRRIERLERDEPARASSWLARAAALILQPRMAGALALVMVLVGAGIGAAQGNLAARQAAQARYVATIAPSPVR
jgi:hypothetical protein